MPSTYTYKTAAGREIKADVYGVDQIRREAGPFVDSTVGAPDRMGSRNRFCPSSRDALTHWLRSRIH